MRTPLLRLQSDEKLVTLVRRGNAAAFELLVSRYEGRLLPFCRHMLRSREDAEDVLQEVFTAAYNAIRADDRPINVRPWLYRIARNRCLNHLRRSQAVGVDSMDVHFCDGGASTADKVHDREEFRLLVGDIRDLPESQRTALLLREMEALSYDQIAEAMETTVSSVKSLLVRARVSLAEAAEARMLSCDEVRLELGAVAEGLVKKPSAPVRRHLKGCERCSTFRVQLKETNKALAALLPLSPLIVLKKLVLAHLGHSAGSSATAAGGGATAAGSGVTAAGAAFGGFGGGVSTTIGLVATKAAAGFAAAALVTAGAVEVHHLTAPANHHHPSATAVEQEAAIPMRRAPDPGGVPGVQSVAEAHPAATPALARPAAKHAVATAHATRHQGSSLSGTAVRLRHLRSATRTSTTARATATAHPASSAPVPPSEPGRTQTQVDATVIPTAPASPPGPPVGGGSSGSAGGSDGSGSTGSAGNGQPASITPGDGAGGSGEGAGGSGQGAGGSGQGAGGSGQGAGPGASTEPGASGASAPSTAGPGAAPDRGSIAGAP